MTTLHRFGHACVLVEAAVSDTTIRVLIDPGTYSAGFESLRDLDRILITHAHPDHLDVERLIPLLAANPHCTVTCDPQTAQLLAAQGVIADLATVTDTLMVGGLAIRAHQSAHGQIHSELPSPSNIGYLVSGIYHPGDSFDLPLFTVSVLLLPVGGPWMKVGDAVDYVRSLRPDVVVPIHDAGLAPIHQQLHQQLLISLAPRDTIVATVAPDGVWTT